MKKYKFADPNYHPKNSCDPTQCNEIIEKIEVALDSHPIDFVKIMEAMYLLNSPSFKYPSVEKCSPTCTAPESNKRWAKALDKLKTIEFEIDEDNIHEIFEVSMLHLSDGKGYFQ